VYNQFEVNGKYGKIKMSSGSFSKKPTAAKTPINAYNLAKECDPNMVHIAICDDEKQIGADLERTLLGIFAEQGINAEVDVYFSGEELCRKMEASAHYDLIYLDIEFAKQEINGVEVGRLIRETHNNNMVDIVYISWGKAYAMELFDIRPMNFLVKPLEHDKVEGTVNTYLMLSKLREGEFVYKSGHGTVMLQLNDIVYFENSGKKIIAHLADGGWNEFYGSLKAVYDEQLKKSDFLFIHASYAVNYNYVTEIRFTQLTLRNSPTPMTISKSKREEVRRRYHGMLRKRGRGELRVES